MPSLPGSVLRLLSVLMGERMDSDQTCCRSNKIQCPFHYVLLKYFRMIILNVVSRLCVPHFPRSPRGSSAVDYFANLRQICTVKTIKVALLSGCGQMDYQGSSLEWVWSNRTIKVALLSGRGQIGPSR